MRVSSAPWVVVCLALLARGDATAAEKPDPFGPAFQKFAEQHCVSCHGPEVQKRQLRPRPAEPDRNAILEGLRQELHAASLTRQQREGRVVLRRLNRIQYDTTLRDLLGTAVEVKELLPDDNVATLESLGTLHGVLKELSRPQVVLVNVACGVEQVETLRFETVNPTFLLSIVRAP